MNEHTLILLEECNSGCKMAISSMDHALENVKDGELMKLLHDYKEKHERLKIETENMLKADGRDGKEPGMMASAFAWITEETKMMLKDDNNQIAKLMMDGSNMGIQSITEYMNKCDKADDSAKSIAKKLVRVEEEFLQELKKFL